MKKNIIIGVIVAVVVGAGAFYGGMTYAQSNRSLQTNLFQQGGASQQGGGRGGRFAGGAGGPAGARGGNFINGQVMSKDDKSVTIKLANGGTQFIFFSPSTQILKTAAGTSDDLQTGTNVSASGTANSDGSVTAQMIQIRPAGMGMMGQTPSSTQQAVPAK